MLRAVRRADAPVASVAHQLSMPSRTSRCATARISPPVTARASGAVSDSGLDPADEAILAPARRPRPRRRSERPTAPHRARRSGRTGRAATPRRIRRSPARLRGATCVEDAPLPRIPLPSPSHPTRARGPYEGRTTNVRSTGSNAVTITGSAGCWVFGLMSVVQLPFAKTSRTYGPPIGTLVKVKSPRRQQS